MYAFLLAAALAQAPADPPDDPRRTDDRTTTTPTTRDALPAEPVAASSPAPPPTEKRAGTGPFARPPIAEQQRTYWVDWLLQDGDRRFQQGRVLAAVGAGTVFIGAGMSLGEVIEGGRQTESMRPGAVIAMAGAPFLLAGLPTMAAGAGRMRKALRMEGLYVPSVPLMGAWSLLGSAVILLPVSTLVWSVPTPALLLAGGLLGMGAYGLANAQYKLNRAADFPRPWVLPMPMRQGAGLQLNARW